MRRLLVTLLTAGLLSSAAAGCRHVAGVCDCDYLDPCYMRAPWAGDFNHGFGNGLHPAGFGASAEELKNAPKTSEKGVDKGSAKKF